MKRDYYLELDIGGTKCAVSVGEVEENHICILEWEEVSTTKDPLETLRKLSPYIFEYVQKYPINV